MSSIVPVLSRRELNSLLSSGPVSMFIDDQWPFKVLSSVQAEPRFFGVFTEGPRAGVGMLLNHENGETTPIQRRAERLELLYPERFALSDFVSYAVRAIVTSGRDYKDVTMDIARSLYYAGIDSKDVMDQWSLAASTEAIAELNQDLDWLSSQWVGQHPCDTIQVTLAVFAKPYLSE